MGGLITFAVVLAVVAWCTWYIRRRVGDDPNGRDELAIALVEGTDPDLWRASTRDAHMRRVQIIGESIHLVRTTKKRATRESRLQLVDETVDELAASGWGGLAQRVRERILLAAEACRECAVAANAVEDADKHLRTVQRSVKPETQRRYLELASRPLRDALPRLSDGPQKAIVERALRDLEDIDGKVAAGLMR